MSDNPINPSHYPNAGTNKDLIANWCDRGTKWQVALAANIEKYVVRATELDDSDPKKLESLKKAQEYLRRWIEFLENK